MSKQIIDWPTCPFCKKTVMRSVAGAQPKDTAYSKTKRGSRIWFHRSCYMQNTRGAQNG